MLEPLSARTLPELVRAGASQWPDVEAVVDGEVRLTFPELAAAVDQVARALVAQGVRPGDRVAVWAPNSWRWVVSALGIVTAGAVLVPLNTRFKGAEAGYILQRTRAVLLIADHGFLGNPYVDMLAGEDLPHLSTVVTLTEHPPGTLAWDAF